MRKEQQRWRVWVSEINLLCLVALDKNLHSRRGHVFKLYLIHQKVQTGTENKLLSRPRLSKFQHFQEPVWSMCRVGTYILKLNFNSYKSYDKYSLRQVQDNKWVIIHSCRKQFSGHKAIQFLACHVNKLAWQNTNLRVTTTLWWNLIPKHWSWYESGDVLRGKGKRTESRVRSAWEGKG